MNLILIPGNSKRNKEWLIAVQEAFSPDFDQSYRHDYLHWDNNNDIINMDLEIDRLSQSVSSLSPYTIFAKSIGSIVTIKAIFEKRIDPHACLIAGLPLAMINDQKIPVNEWLQSISTPILIAQNAKDPLGSYIEVSRYIDTVKGSKIKTIELESDSHDYTNLDLLKMLMRNIKD